MSWYTTGSVNLTNGSKTVTGVGTKWTNPLIGICAGQMLILKKIDTIEICEIASVQSDTQLTLANKYAGVTKTGVNYEIPTAPNVSVEHLALRISEMLNYYQQQMEGWQTVLTGEGEVTLTAPDGRIVTIKSQYSIQDELIKLVEKGKNFSEIAIQNAELSNNASQSAKNSESSAKTSADNAAKFADSASQSAKNAGNSATSAKTAETGAQTSAKEAKQSALDAKNWASTVDTTTFVKKSGDTIPENLTIKKNDAKISIINEDNCGLILHAQSRTNNLLFLFVNDGKSDYKMAYNQGRNSIEFRALDDVKINGKSALKAGDGGLLSYTQTVNDVFAPEITTGFYRWDGNSINTPYKGLGYFNKISWNANESTVLAHGYNTNRLFIGYKHKSTGDVKYDEILKFGDCGIGAPTGTTAQNLDEHLNSGFYGTNTAKIPNLPFTGGGSASSLLVLPSESPYWKVEQLSVVNGRIPKIYYRTDTKNDGKQAWYEAITTANASADIVGALPAVKTGANNTPIYKVGDLVDFNVKPKINGIEPIYIVESYVNGNNWYNVYSNGFIEQSGIVNVITNTISATCGTLVNLLKPMKTKNYSVAIDKINNGGWVNIDFSQAGRMETSFYIASFASYTGEAMVRWTVRGY